MARPKESNEQKVLKVHSGARCVRWDIEDYIKHYTINDEFGNLISSKNCNTYDEAWSDALTQIRKAKIKAAKDKRKPIKVPKEIKKHVGLTMYPSDKAIIVKGFGSVQKFLDLSIREYKIK